MRPFGTHPPGMKFVCALLMFCTAVGLTAAVIITAAVAAALLGIRTADTGLAAFFSLIKVKHDSAYNCQHD